MKVLSRLTFLICSLLLTKMSIAQNKVVIKECNCNVVLPGKFKSYIDTFHTAIGDLINYTYILKDSTLSYQLSFVDYPVGTMHSDSTDMMQDFFQSTMDEAVLKTKGVKKYESEITQFGYAGWFWKINFGKDRFVKTKAFMAGRRYYMMQVIGNVKYDIDRLTFRYFDSFQFIDLAKVKE